jgi:hypothetical protein
MFDDEGDPEVETIRLPNSKEEAAQRYWRASRIWRDQEESNWNCGMMIQELNDIRCYQGIVSSLALTLLDDVVNDRRTHILILDNPASNDTQEIVA